MEHTTIMAGTVGTGIDASNLVSACTAENASRCSMCRLLLGGIYSLKLAQEYEVHSCGVQWLLSNPATDDATSSHPCPWLAVYYELRCLTQHTLSQHHACSYFPTHATTYIACSSKYLSIVFVQTDADDGYVCGIARLHLLDLHGYSQSKFKVPLMPYTTIRGAASLDWKSRPGNYMQVRLVVILPRTMLILF